MSKYGVAGLVLHDGENVAIRSRSNSKADLSEYEDTRYASTRFCVYTFPPALANAGSPLEEDLPACLLDLTDDVLEAVLLRLQLRERVRATTCCRLLHELGLRSASLWRSMELLLSSGPTTSSFQDWLRRRRQLLGRLWVRGPLGVGPPRREDDKQVLDLGGGSIGASLTALWLEDTAPLCLRPQSLPALQQLRWLSVAGPVVVPSLAYSQLAALTCLHLDSTRYSGLVQHGCLPLGLRELRWRAHGIGRWTGSRFVFEPFSVPSHIGCLPSVEAAGTQLTRLELVAAPALLESHVSALGRLQGLKVLSLACCHLPCFPPGLQQLSHLSVLDLRNNILASESESDTKGLGVLSALTSLEELSLAGCALRAIPASALGLPRLQVLHIMGNPLVLPMPWEEGEEAAAAFHGPALSSLQELGIDAEAACCLLPSLLSLPQLQALHLQPGQGTHALRQVHQYLAQCRLVPAVGGAHLPSPLRRLAQLPGLQRVTYSLEVERIEARFGSPMPAWLAALRWECAAQGLSSKWRDAPGLPGLRSSTPWDEPLG